MRLVFVTGNAGKFGEAERFLEGLALLEQDRGGYQEVQADTLEEVAKAGLDDVATRRDPPFFLEDSGLFIDHLEGFPGVYSAYVHQTIGLQGILRLLEGVPDVKRTARFEAVIAYRDEGHRDHLFHGTADGRIAHAVTGDGGFGYDPIFIPKGGGGRTFAQLPPDEKGRLSHRGAALRALTDHLSRSGRSTKTLHRDPS